MKIIIISHITDTYKYIYIWVCWSVYNIQCIVIHKTEYLVYKSTNTVNYLENILTYCIRISLGSY